MCRVETCNRLGMGDCFATMAPPGSQICLSKKTKTPRLLEQPCRPLLVVLVPVAALWLIPSLTRGSACAWTFTMEPRNRRTGVNGPCTSTRAPAWLLCTKRAGKLCNKNTPGVVPSLDDYCSKPETRPNSSTVATKSKPGP